jgi:hypothetical protein
MKSTTLNDIKKEINQLSARELAELFLLLAKFKKENKEYLSYLLFESHNKRACTGRNKSGNKRNGFGF